jgi:hypothetical protein
MQFKTTMKAGRVIQLVEHRPSRHKALISNTSAAKQKSLFSIYGNVTINTPVKLIYANKNVKVNPSK